MTARALIYFMTSTHTTSLTALLVPPISVMTAAVQLCSSRGLYERADHGVEECERRTGKDANPGGEEETGGRVGGVAKLPEHRSPQQHHKLRDPAAHAQTQTSARAFCAHAPSGRVDTESCLASNADLYCHWHSHETISTWCMSRTAPAGGAAEA